MRPRRRRNRLTSERSCLACDRMFASLGPGNRLCHFCRAANRHRRVMFGRRMLERQTFVIAKVEQDEE